MMAQCVWDVSCLQVTPQEQLEALEVHTLGQKRGAGGGGGGAGIRQPLGWGDGSPLPAGAGTAPRRHRTPAAHPAPSCCCLSAQARARMLGECTHRQGACTRIACMHAHACARHTHPQVHTHIPCAHIAPSRCTRVRGRPTCAKPLPHTHKATHKAQPHPCTHTHTHTSCIPPPQLTIQVLLELGELLGAERAPLRALLHSAACGRRAAVEARRWGSPPAFSPPRLPQHSSTPPQPPTPPWAGRAAARLHTHRSAPARGCSHPAATHPAPTHAPRGDAVPSRPHDEAVPSPRARAELCSLRGTGRG